MRLFCGAIIFIHNYIKGERGDGRTFAENHNYYPMYAFLISFWELMLSMAPYLLLGFGIAGVLHAFVPVRAYHRFLARPGFRSVLNATLLGIPLPLCSCGVLPTTVSLRRSGASRGACTSFLITTPQTGVDSILATYSLLGLPFAIIRPVAALVTGVFGGLLTDRLFRNQRFADEDGRHAASAGGCGGDESNEGLSFLGKCRKALTYAFGELLEDVGKWLLIGLVAAALITTLVPDGFFEVFRQWPLLNMLLVLALAIPMYVCATGSIPIALSLMLKGMTPGAAFVLLMAGPAINAASLLVVERAFGRKQAAVYLTSIVAGALAFGLAMDYLLPGAWFIGAAQQAAGGAGVHGGAGAWLQPACAALLTLLLARALWRRRFAKKAGGNEAACTAGCTERRPKAGDGGRTLLLTVRGMRCRHCANNVTEALMKVDGVASVEVELATGKVVVTGEADAVPEETIIRNEIEKAGYSAE